MWVLITAESFPGALAQMQLSEQAVKQRDHGSAGSRYEAGLGLGFGKWLLYGNPKP